jgi:hypothetical protein
VLVVALLNIINGATDNTISISISQNSQSVSVNQEEYQTIGIENNNPTQEVNVLQDDANQEIKIDAAGVNGGDFAIAIDSKVPKALSILPQMTEEMLWRPNNRFYVDADGSPHFTTLEQLKAAACTKIWLAEEMETSRVADGDFVLLEV